MADSEQSSSSSSVGSSSGQATNSSSNKLNAPSIWEIYFPKHVEGHRDVVHLASFPEIIFFWPLLVANFFCAFLQAATPISPVFCGWLLLIVFALNILALVQDFDQKQFFILILVLIASILGIWIINLYGFSIFKSLAAWILSFQPSFSTDAYLLQGFVLLICLGWGLACPLFNYWRLEQNEFIHFTQPIGRDMSIARLGCTVYKEVPDILECILTFGGGTLIIKRENQILASIPNVPFLSRRMAQIEHMLSETRVTISTEGK